ncbi:type VII secretion protein EccB [Streptacidiphilus sp. MAP5-3]|uniref:type VII secretion protein EccB n=1 Tax=unclassified Streptacidiphilus TaxID=2643834 RepID=UPI0035192A40
MASRRNELSAYTFARRRTVAAFLQPSGGGNVDDAPKALRAVVPSLVLGAVAIAAFGAYGMLKPSAPKGWQSANDVIVDKETTTRYVMLGGQLHPVLNIASARLLLSGNSGVEYIEDSALNAPGVSHGVTVGIPYAPDSLPSATDAATPKTWAACERSDATSGDPIAQKLFVLGGSEAGTVGGQGRLNPHQALYVQTPENSYLVDSSGVAHQLVANGAGSEQTLADAAFGLSYGKPQQVTDTWLQTLQLGDSISLPSGDIPGYGSPYTGASIGDQGAKIGDLLQAKDPSGNVMNYVLLQDGPHRISDFARGLVAALHNSTQEQSVGQFDMAGANQAAPFESTKNWPQDSVTQVNNGGESSSAMAACAVYGGSMGQSGAQLGVWVGQNFPVNKNSGSAGVYVTPGTGMLLQSVSGQGGSGQVYLLTDTGLRYPVQMNSDGTSGSTSSSTSGSTSGGQSGSNGGASGGSSGSSGGAAGGAAGAGADPSQSDTAAARLGYGQVQPLPVPGSFAGMVPSGPALSKDAAQTPQGS